MHTSLFVYFIMFAVLVYILCYIYTPSFTLVITMIGDTYIIVNNYTYNR